MDNQNKFRNIYSQHSEAILRYALRRTSAPEQAADAVAETFTVAWQKIEAVPGNQEAKYWLYGVARRVLANHYRKQAQADQLREGLQNFELTSDSPDFTNQTVAQIAVTNAMAQLAPEDAELMRLATWEGFKSNEIAQIFGIPAATVRTRKMRINNELRTILTRSAEAQSTQTPETSEHFTQNKHSSNKAVKTAAEETN